MAIHKIRDNWRLTMKGKCNRVPPIKLMVINNTVLAKVDQAKRRTKSLVEINQVTRVTARVKNIWENGMK